VLPVDLDLKSSPDVPLGEKMLFIMVVQEQQQQQESIPIPQAPAVCDVDGCMAMRKYRLVRDWERGACEMGMEHPHLFGGAAKSGCGVGHCLALSSNTPLQRVSRGCFRYNHSSDVTDEFSPVRRARSTLTIPDVLNQSHKVVFSIESLHYSLAWSSQCCLAPSVCHLYCVMNKCRPFQCRPSDNRQAPRRRARRNILLCGY
jgi:hypothetical protein